ncbi:MAG: hypothetical protein V2I35_11205 [Desulfocapsaceae bacterium]|jgi:hypothetical protein|nr:hypothetical protein [Desulfocapsaceae bacterium]
MNFKEHWNLETAMEILKNKTVDSKLWAEAVEWLLLYGPPEIVSLLLKASGQATDDAFPELQSKNYTRGGQPIYDIEEIAQSLGISENEVREIIIRKEMRHNTFHVWDDGSSETIH